MPISDQSRRNNVYYGKGKYSAKPIQEEDQTREFPETLTLYSPEPTEPAKLQPIRTENENETTTKPIL